MSAHGPAISFEVFPPSPSAAGGLDALAATVSRLSALDPAFVSVTYGAGGGQRERSFDAIRTVGAASHAPVAGHLTCVGQSRADVDGVVERYADLGVTRIVALRGDPPDGVDAPYRPHPRGYRQTADLVASISARGGFDVAVSAYPERHPQSPSDDHDLDVLAAKVDAGATTAITQMFFDNECYVRYRDRVAARGIDVAIVPGVFPIHSFDAVARFAARCGAAIPTRVAERFAGLGDDPAAARPVAAGLAAEQIAGLVEYGAEHIHLYTLNRAELALDVCDRLGIRSREAA